MTATEQARIVIIGGGPAGYPGGIPGGELADRMREQAVSFGATVVTDEVAAVQPGGPPFTVTTTDRTYHADAVIIATGARSRRLGLPSEDEYDGRGVCYCAICDGPLFAGQRVAVVGGGDAAVEEALALRRIASHVTLVHRRTELRAGAALRASLLESDIEVLTPYVVDEVLGGDLGVTGVRVRDVDDGSVRDLDVTGLFVAIGHEPASGLFEAYLKTDGHGFLWTESGTTATSVPGVFAAGDVADPRYRQAITAAASGCAAAIDAERWLLAHREQPSSPMHAEEEPHAGW
ncbi:MAG: thioredoxin-disulfide reductase [Actinobacteria bacterium]|nr:MAG: thioredoxin-disulfide reductase [Actinomycetota bacterium]